ncbi:MAG: HAD-IA family hydrolase [Phycisphaeraceae bacterium]|nr:HAD-IA family hydrolase [Phycisphaeraceae bacterium]MCP4797781.1 HAD-IA family hydrolase [Phycisphaeraceae bacterium]
MVICFDLGGVLVRICRDWNEGCAAAGIDPRTHQPRPGHDDRARALIARYQRGEVECVGFQRELSELFDGLWTPDEVARIDRAWILGSYRGTVGLVDDLQAAGHRTACLSNTSHSHWDMLLEDPAVSRLDVRHASHILRLHKPDSRIYEAFEADLGVTGSEIVFFDDLQPNVDAALERGWDAIRIDHETETVPQMRASLRTRGLLESSGSAD